MTQKKETWVSFESRDYSNMGEILSGKVISHYNYTDNLEIEYYYNGLFIKRPLRKERVIEYLNPEVEVDDLVKYTEPGDNNAYIIGYVRSIIGEYCDVGLKNRRHLTDKRFRSIPKNQLTIVSKNA